MPDTTAAARRLLHTMLRVRNLERSLAFYRDCLGLRELRRLEFPVGRFTLVYLGYGDDREQTVIELTHNWDEAGDYTHGSGYGHLGIGVPRLAEFCDGLVRAGVKVLRAPGEMMSSGIVIAFIEDPDGYKIELIELPYPPPGMAAQVTFS